jgi:regulator of RNase E activity RraB
MIRFKYKSELLQDGSCPDTLIDRKILNNFHFEDFDTLIKFLIGTWKYIKDLYLESKKSDQFICLDLKMTAMNEFAFLTATDLPYLITNKIKKNDILTSSLNPKYINKVKENHYSSGFIGKPLTSQILQKI